MKITSSVFVNNDYIPAKYTCDGENINPPLAFADVPAETKSLVLIVDDPDAPTKVWVHWALYNVDPKTTVIAENSVPQGAQALATDFDKASYGGPCPPSGTHRYFFKLYALNILLNFSSQSGKKELEEAMVNHILAKAELIGLYKRS